MGLPNRLGFWVDADEFPASLADRRAIVARAAMRVADIESVAVIGTGFPKPVAATFGKVAKALFARDRAPLGLGAARKFAHQAQEEPRGQSDQAQHHAERDTGFPLPFGKDDIGRRRNGDDQRQIADLLIDEKPFDAVEFAGSLEISRARFAEMSEVR